MNNKDINIDIFGEWQNANNLPPQYSPSLNQIIENNRLNISNSMLYSKLEKLESDIEQIKNILLRTYIPQSVQYQTPQSLFNGVNVPFINNANTNTNNNNNNNNGFSQRPLL